MLIVITLILAAGVLVLLAVGMAYVLGWANVAFHVEVDPKYEAVMDALPGANCGGCGYVGCSEYAEAVVEGKADVSLCAPGGAGCAKRLAEIMGVEVSQTYPYRAVVHCVARQTQRLQRTEYHGEQTCAAANLVADVQGCIYGCLGLGDCERACDYDAIHILDGLAVVDYEKCIGCKACARVCPRNIITMIPFKAERVLVVGCSNLDFGPDVTAVCEVGCIGCKACSKKANLTTMQGNLPEINYEEYDPDWDFSVALEKCPRESLVFVGKPTEKDLSAVVEEDLPERVTADFETTVDKTGWRG